MDKIYLVSGGDYSDYKVYGAFTSTEKAQQYIDKLGSDKFGGGGYYGPAKIEERAVDPIVPEPPPNRKPYRVQITEDGKVISCELRSPLEIDEDGSVKLYEIGPESGYGIHPFVGGAQFIQFWPIGSYGGSGWHITGYALDINCYAADDQHAAKIANEKRVQFLAVHPWPKTEDDRRRMEEVLLAKPVFA